jgi:hypothetical protein
VSWDSDVSVEVVELFAEAQRFGDHFLRRPRRRFEATALIRERQAKQRRRERLALMRRLRSIDHREHLAKLRARYDDRRGTKEHEEMLARAKSRSAARYASMSELDRQARAQAESARRQRRRIERIGELSCAECGAELVPAKKGPAPRFCHLHKDKRRRSRL